MPEATPEFKERLLEAFKELELGRTFTYRRTSTEGALAMFCGTSGDYNPYHQTSSSPARAGSANGLCRGFSRRA